jgi:hypothetical protein
MLNGFKAAPLLLAALLAQCLFVLTLTTSGFVGGHGFVDGLIFYINPTTTFVDFFQPPPKFCEIRIAKEIAVAARGTLVVKKSVSQCSREYSRLQKRIRFAYH